MESRQQVTEQKAPPAAPAIVYRSNTDPRARGRVAGYERMSARDSARREAASRLKKAGGVVPSAEHAVATAQRVVVAVERIPGLIAAARVEVQEAQQGAAFARAQAVEAQAVAAAAEERLAAALVTANAARAAAAEDVRLDREAATALEALGFAEQESEWEQAAARKAAKLADRAEQAAAQAAAILAQVDKG